MKTLRKLHSLRTLACACAVLLVPSSFGQTGTNAAAGAAAPKAPPLVSTDKYALKPGDKVALRVVESRDEPVVLTVSSGGEIEVPYLGRRLVMGRIIPQVEAELKVEYEKEYYYHATVQISLESINPVAEARAAIRRIYVTGQVPSQGAQEIPEGDTYTVSKAILRAGGLASFANGRKVRVVRKGQDKKEEPITVDVLSILEDGKVENDVELQPDDLIIVPEKLINW